MLRNISGHSFFLTLFDTSLHTSRKRDQVSKNIIKRFVFDTFGHECAHICRTGDEVSKSNVTKCQLFFDTYSREAPGKHPTHQASAERTQQALKHGCIEPAPNSPSKRQTHHTSAKRTKPAPNASEPAPYTPNQRQTHRADAKRTASEKDLGECRGGLMSDLGLTTQLQTNYKLVVNTV